MDSDDKWFNNPQIRFTITKNVKTMYIALMQSDIKMSGIPYGSCNFSLFHAKVFNLLTSRINLIGCGSR